MGSHRIGSACTTRCTAPNDRRRQVEAFGRNGASSRLIFRRTGEAGVTQPPSLHAYPAAGAPGYPTTAYALHAGAPAPRTRGEDSLSAAPFTTCRPSWTSSPVPPPALRR